MAYIRNKEHLHTSIVVDEQAIINHNHIRVDVDLCKLGIFVTHSDMGP